MAGREERPSTILNFTIRRHYLLLLGALLFFSGTPKLSAQATADPCADVGSVITSSRLLPLSEYKKCLQTFPFDAAQAKAVLNTMWKTLIQIYPYTDIAIKAPDDRLYSRLRLRRQLLRIQKTVYETDFDFHADLSSTIEKLNDGHTGWTPECYEGSIATISGLPMLQVWDSSRNKSVVKVAPTEVFTVLVTKGYGILFNATAEAAKTDNLLTYAGAEVEEIDGMAAMDYVTIRARRVGGYRHQQTRINSLFVRPSARGGLGNGYFLGELMSPSNIPKNSSFTVTLKRKSSNTSETFAVPYFAYYFGDFFNSSSQFYALNCEATPIEESAATGSVSVNQREPMSMGTSSLQFDMPYNTPRERPVLQPRGSTVEEFASTAASEASYQRLSLESDFIQVYLLADMTTAVMTIPDFLGSAVNSPSEANPQDVFVFELLTAYNTVASSGAPRLIIDLSNNGGGFVNAAAILTQLFFPSSSYPGFFSQFKANNFIQQAYNQASTLYPIYTGSDFDISGNGDATGAPFNSSSEFFVPLETITRNNGTAPYCAPFKKVDLLTYRYRILYPNTFPTLPLFDPNNIVLLTNGLCYSSCALFSYQMRQLHNVTVVTIGGRQDVGPFAFADGAVGFVSENFTSFYIKNVKNLNLESSEYAPPPLAVKGSLRFTLTQSFGPKSSTTPQEFIYEPSQIKLRYTEENVLSLPVVWTEVATLFSG